MTCRQTTNSVSIHLSIALIGCVLMMGAVRASSAAPVSSQPAPQAAGGFMASKTTLQTNCNYDPRMAIAVDSVIVHLHGADEQSLTRSIASWTDQGYTVGRMFFADSDAINEYWTGKWDGTPHPDEVERNPNNKVVECEGVRPYMLPTTGWTRYLQEMATESIDAGAVAILPEEPLAHAYTGYEEAFKKIWRERYGTPWQAENSSPQARFLTAQLKNELYLKLERELGKTVKAHAAKLGHDVAFIFPVHSLFSNLAARLVAPLGTSTAIEQIDGYIGQVWTGPVNWASANYDSPDKSFFASAYVLYDYFVELTRGSKRKLWLLVDPVEDDPNHAWDQFEKWYCHCLVAQMLFPTVDSYEVMPWPDRIFMPGYQTGGGTPAPERFRVITLSAIQVQQEIPSEGQWLDVAQPDREVASFPTIGIAVADNALWHKQEKPTLQGLLSLFLPLVREGIPPTACVLERATEPGYLNHFKVIVLCYENIKPIEPATNVQLAEWVKRGGSLVVLGQANNLGDRPFWWTDAGTTLPPGDCLSHLLRDNLGLDVDKEFDQQIGSGFVHRRLTSPRRFADPAIAQAEYLPLIARALYPSDDTKTLPTPGGFCMKRGPFIVAHAIRKPITLTGPLVDLLDPTFPVLDRVELPRDQSGLYRDVRTIMNPGKGTQPEPRVLHATHRLISEQHRSDQSVIVIRGPAETPAVVRLFTAGRQVKNIVARTPAGTELTTECKNESATTLIRFPNTPKGTTLTIHWAS